MMMFPGIWNGVLMHIWSTVGPYFGMTFGVGVSFPQLLVRTCVRRCFRWHVDTVGIDSIVHNRMKT